MEPSLAALTVHLVTVCDDEELASLASGPHQASHILCCDLQLAMHSIREMCSVDDCSHAYNHFMSFMEDFTALDASIDVDSLEDAEILGTVEETPCNHVQ